MSGNSSINIIPTQSILFKAQVIHEDLLPPKSRKLYDEVYKKFRD